MKLVKLIVIGIILCSNSYAYGTNGCDSKTVLLMHNDGANASTTFTDADCDGNGKKVLTASGGAVLDTSKKVFGPSSGLFDFVTFSYVAVPSSTDFAMGTGDFTVDFWVNFASVISIQFFQTDASVNNFDVTWYNTDSTLRTFLAGVGYSFSWAPSTGVWYHVAISRNGSNLRAFVNGSQIGTTQSSSDNVAACALQIGGSATVFFNGNLDEYRITKGVARWTANFTPPSTPYCSGCEQAGFAINE